MRTDIKNDEKIICQVRKHWIVLGKALTVAILGVVVRLYPGLSHSMSIAGSLSIELIAIYLFYDWRFDIWVVTDRRVIDEWGVFSSNTKETPLRMIQNIDYRQNVIGRMMNFGDVIIQSAAHEGETENRIVSSPALLKESIMRAKEQEDQSKELLRTTSNDDMECPHCAEIIKVKAKICKHCKQVIS